MRPLHFCLSSLATFFSRVFRFCYQKEMVIFRKCVSVSRFFYTFFAFSANQGFNAFLPLCQRGGWVGGGNGAFGTRITHSARLESTTSEFFHYSPINKAKILPHLQRQPKLNITSAVYSSGFIFVETVEQRFFFLLGEWLAPRPPFFLVLDHPPTHFSGDPPKFFFWANGSAPAPHFFLASAAEPILTGECLPCVCIHVICISPKKVFFLPPAPQK